MLHPPRTLPFRRQDTPAADSETEPAGPEIEVFYTFTWGRNAGNRRPQQGGKPRGKGAPKGGKPKGKGQRRDGGNKPQNFAARPPKKEKAIDPDNPFAAALMGLKDGK